VGGRLVHLLLPGFVLGVQLLHCLFDLLRTYEN
jgi:hypothetical protein